MKKMMGFLLIALILVLALAGCGGKTTVSTAWTAAVSEMADSSGLDADYEDALSVQGQLALGTLHLDDTDLGIDAALAAELLPLWQMLLSLSDSDMASSVEIDALVRQIQNTMDAEQITAIAAMELTSENLAAMMASGDLQMESADQSKSDSDGGFAAPDGAMSGGALPDDGFAPAVMSGNEAAADQVDGESADLSGFQERALVSAAVQLLEGKNS